MIEDEEEKIERELLKILGHMAKSEIIQAAFAVSAQCHQVNVVEGHTAAVRVKLSRAAELDQVRDALATFTSMPQKLGLHSAPAHPIIVRAERDRPQPRLDRDAGRGMSVTVGRLERDGVLDYRFVVIAHNTIRGAAGAAILNAEFLVATRLLSASRRTSRVSTRRLRTGHTR
jgi:aspartate-semialdehyde dehydrogenase